MPQNVHLEMSSAEAERRLEPSEGVPPDEHALRLSAAELARNLSWLPSESPSRVFVERCRKLSKAFKPLLRRLQLPLPATGISDDARWLYDNVHLIVSELDGAADTFKLRRKIPHVRTPNGAII